jgi:hypothetical protein
LDTAPDVAAHSGTFDKLGEWVAGIVGARDRVHCRLTVQRQTADGFALLERIEVPCIVDFTRLAWVDVTGDGNDELLLRTIPPYEDTYKTGAGLQRLYIYAVDDRLIELATLDGILNGSDGVGIRWEDVDGDAVSEILVGLPLLDIEARTLPVTLTRRFLVYRWDATTREFVARSILTQNDID